MHLSGPFEGSNESPAWRAHLCTTCDTTDWSSSRGHTRQLKNGEGQQNLRAPATPGGGPPAECLSFVFRERAAGSFEKKQSASAFRLAGPRGLSFEQDGQGQHPLRPEASAE